jgi:hypothetical protein
VCNLHITCCNELLDSRHGETEASTKNSGPFSGASVNQVSVELHNPVSMSPDEASNIKQSDTTNTCVT